MRLFVPSPIPSFEDEIESEFHSHLLTSGNLNKPKPPPQLETQWEFKTYVARVQQNNCTCGESHRVLHGIFLRQVSKAGSVLDQALSTKTLQVPLDQSYPIEVTQFPVHVCPSCLPSKGFKE
jgi:hypothetical protein